MPAGLPSLTPTGVELQAELANAATVVAAAPGGNYKTAIRPPGISDLNWWSNLAYYLSYPAAAPKIKAGDTAAADAWRRCNAAVSRLVLAAVPSSPSWNPKKPTWPLPTPPADWSAGSSFGARRPWPKSKPQTRQHTGTDLRASSGTPILAPESGTIVAAESGWEMVKDKTTGEWRGVKCLIMVTDSGLTLLLGGTRPGSALVKDGARVEAGQQLAEVGVYPLGDSMLHVSGYDQPLSEAQVNARKSWPLGSAPPANLIDLGPYLKAAGANPKSAAKQGLVGDKGGEQLVPNDVEGGELDEGTSAGDPAEEPVPDDESPVPDDGGGGGGGGGGVAVAIIGAVFGLALTTAIAVSLGGRSWGGRHNRWAGSRL